MNKGKVRITTNILLYIYNHSLKGRPPPPPPKLISFCIISKIWKNTKFAVNNKHNSNIQNNYKFYVKIQKHILNNFYTSSKKQTRPSID